MQMLYDSDTFVVLHMQPDLGQPEKILLSDGRSTCTPACDARYSAAINCGSVKALTLMMIRAF